MSRQRAVIVAVVAVVVGGGPGGLAVNPRTFRRLYRIGFVVSNAADYTLSGRRVEKEKVQKINPNSGLTSA